MIKKKVMDETIIHMFEYHTIIHEEMTSEMKSKIRENIHLYRDLVRAQIQHEVSDILKNYHKLFNSDVFCTNSPSHKTS
jgi:hypothetical protein